MTVFAVTIAVEGTCDESVVSRLVRDHGFAVGAVHGLHGVDYLNERLKAFNKAARFGPWLVVRDLDKEADCAAIVVRARLPEPSKGMRFRIAHRAIEAWLLADVEGVVSYFKVTRESVPHDPEALDNPKEALVNLMRRSRSRGIREDMVPAPGTTARVGPGFVARITEFASSSWSWRRATERSDSLRRCVRRLDEWG
jgi:hypothetical protein